MKKEHQADHFFQSEVVIVYLANSPEAFAGGIAVKNPVVEERYGKKMLTGEVPFNPNDWTSGLPIGICFDQIAHFLLFSTEEEYFEKTALQYEEGDWQPLH